MRLVPTTLAALALVLPALAAEPPPLDDLAACRQTPDIVQVRFRFDGGACERIGNTDIELAVKGRGRLWVETEATAEVCTMQIVPILVDEEYELERQITALDVEAYNPAGALAGRSSIDIAASCEGAAG